MKWISIVLVLLLAGCVVEKSESESEWPTWPHGYRFNRIEHVYKKEDGSCIVVSFKATNVSADGTREFGDYITNNFDAAKCSKVKQGYVIDAKTGEILAE